MENVTARTRLMRNRVSKLRNSLFSPLLKHGNFLLWNAPEMIEHLAMLRRFLIPSLALLLPPVFICFSSNRLLWDETYHIGLVHKLYLGGLSPTFLREMNVAMGPLYAIFLYLLSLIKGAVLPIKIFRILTWLFYCGTLFLVPRLFSKNSPRKENTVLLLMALPIFSLMSVFAMSDVPVLFLFCLSLFFALKAGENLSCFWKSHTYIFLSGLMLGLCVTGRQTYLVSLAGFFWLALRVKEYRRFFFTFLLAAIPLPMILFSLWGGITPPLIAAIEVEKSHLSSTHFFLSISQSALVYYFLFPRQFLKKWRYALCLVAVFILLTPWIDRYLIAELSERLPLRFFFQKLLGPWHPTVARYVMVSTFALGILWLGQFLVQLVKCTDVLQQALLMSGIALAVHPLLVAHNYSSRYILGGILILALVGNQRPESSGAWKWLRFILGYGLAMSVAAFYLEVSV